jgi:glycine oxidase
LTDPNIAIVGGGVIGLAIARELHRRGERNIAIIEKGEPGREASWAAAGILAPQAEADSADAFFELCAESNRLFPRFAIDLREETGIDIELDATGVLYIALTDEDEHELGERFRWQHAAGLNVERLSREEALKLEPALSPDVRSALRFPDDRQVENRKLVAALIRYAELNEIRVISSTEVTNFPIVSGRVSGVESANETFAADRVVLATGAWSSLITVGGQKISLPVMPVRGQMISFAASEICRHVIYSRRGYLVPRADGRLLAGATADPAGFDSSVRDADTRKLRTAAEEIVPALGDLPAAESWAGLRPMAADSMPVIGAFTGAVGLYVATGHYRNGILLAPLTARLIADAIEGKRLDRYHVFSPDRLAK